MKNVLVFPCGTEIGLEINRALAHSIHFKLIGAGSVEDHGSLVYAHYINGVPFVDDPAFIPALQEIVRTHHIDFIVPAHDSVVLKLAEHHDQLGAEVIGSPLRTCEVCRSKKLTYEVFEQILPTPHVFSAAETHAFPLFLKPDVGQGSKGTYRVHSEEEVAFYLKKDPSLLLLEYLPGKEYTIDCFTDRHGQLRFAAGRERARISNGISVQSQPINDERFTALAEKINTTLTFRGVWFYQVKERSNGELVLMEIAPRIAGTMALYRALGVNFIQLSLFDRLGFDIDVFANDFEIEIDRALFARYRTSLAYTDVYIDFDDTIILNGHVNTDMIKLLYQCRNQGKRIHLITKHRASVDETLRTLAISTLLFDRIIHLQPEEKKSTHIEAQGAIFIDDSFAERKEVRQQLNIPVFSVDGIEALLDGKV